MVLFLEAEDGPQDVRRMGSFEIDIRFGSAALTDLKFGFNDYSTTNSNMPGSDAPKNTRIK
jgi:hypothetical protein